MGRKPRIRKKLVVQKGKVARLVVYKSNKFLYAQIIDDLEGKTLVQANTREKDFPVKSRKNLESAKTLGQIIAKRATEKKVEKIVFDRNGYTYHGRIKAVADGAREAGLSF
jgi:large subunit ribosomal protein L18